MTIEHASEIPQPITAPESLLKLKDEMTTLWQQLPAEHQASTALVLLEAVMESDYKLWLREALATLWPVGTDSLPASFAVLHPSRKDLVHVGFSDEEIQQLSNADLQEVAVEIRDRYVHHTYWEELKFTATGLLAEKGEARDT